MIIMKFGGSSLATSERVKEVAGIIKNSLAEKPIIVLSAMGNTTDDLLAAGQAALRGEEQVDALIQFHMKIASELDIDHKPMDALLDELSEVLTGVRMLKELSPRTLDYLTSFGERLSVRTMAAYLETIGVSARHFDAWDIGFSSDSVFMDARLTPETEPAIHDALGGLEKEYSYTPIITGFLAKDANGDVTTLGRGGSDLTASVIGAAVGACEIQVWKDVDGIMTTDPRLVKDALPVPEVSFDEASELAYFGAKVLHPRSILPAMKRNIPVRVKNSYNPDHPGTVIVNKRPAEGRLVRALALKKDVTLIDIVSTRMLGQYGFLAKVFSLFEQHKVSVDMVATSEVSISLTIDERNGISSLVSELETFSNVKVNKSMTIVSIVGDVSRSSEILARAAGALQTLGINIQMISQGASKVNIGLIVDNAQAAQSIQGLHELFFGNEVEA
ncbi:MAG: aspartate kinase [archaeon]